MQLSLSHSDKTAAILERVRPVFGEKGFDGASMQDLARAADMSVGNFYRYFPSKDAIVEAMVDQDLSGMSADFASVLASDRPMALFRALLARRMEERRENCDGALWAEMQAAAFRRPAIAAAIQRMEDGISSSMISVFARQAGLPPDLARERFEDRARLILMLIKTALMTSACEKARSEHLTAEVFRIVDDILSGIDPAHQPQG